MTYDSYDNDRIDRHAGPAAAASTGIVTASLALIALGVLLSASWQAVSRVRQRPRTTPRRLQTWEGEGGRPYDVEPVMTEGSADMPV